MGTTGHHPIRSRNDLLWELMIWGRTFLPTPTTLKGNTPDISKSSIRTITKTYLMNE